MFSETVVILAAGRGTRMKSDIPKVLIEVAGKPIIQHVIDFWVKEGAKEFIFVLGYQYGQVVRYLDKIPMDNWTFVVQEPQKGIADAILRVESTVPYKFIVALGDCLNIGSFEYPESMEQGYGILDNGYKDIQARGCNVIVFGNDVTGVIEKPTVEYAGIGTYFFSKRIFDYIKYTKPSERFKEIQIADVMNGMLVDGWRIKAVPFYGDFINCTYPRDIEYANQLLSMGTK